MHKINSVPWLIVLTVIGIAWYSTWKHPSEWYPKIKQGVDTVYAGDSAYVIKFKIDTAYELKREIEPKEDPH